MFLLFACASPDDKAPGEEADADTDADTDTDTDGRYFPADAPWYTSIEDAAVDPDSDTMLAGWAWGSGDFQLDWSLEVLEADASTPRRAFQPTADFYSPDCDAAEVPVPDDGNVEGEDGYACESDGDCHLLVAERDEGRLYEMWRADLRGDTFRGGCLAVWDMTRTYPPEGRGDQCTSADAAGYPLSPMLFTADEVAAGEIDHALRFAVPNDVIDNDVYHHPATHATSAGADGPLPYGARLRLKADFDEARVADPDALVVVRALQTYGMVLADGGNVPLMAESDRRATAKWADLFEDGSHALFGIAPTDFEVVALEPPAVDLTYDCVRSGY